MTPYPDLGLGPGHFQRSERMLFDALKNVAASADAQRAYLRSIGTFPCLDELALEYNDIVHVYLQYLAADSAKAIALRNVDEQLDAISGMKFAELWDEPALDGPEWRRIRERAQFALTKFEASSDAEPVSLVPANGGQQSRGWRLANYASSLRHGLLTRWRR